ncbi:hypothetical protein ACFL6O_03645 [candidate division KSB1 bacterium]
MKAIRYILVSYVQMEFLHLFNFVLGVLYFIVGNIKVFSGDGFHDDFFSTWHFFLLALIMITPQLVTQTQRLIRFNAENLIPDKLLYYFLAAGIVYLPFIVMPVIYVANLGLPLLPHIAMLLIIPASLLIFTDIPHAGLKLSGKGGKYGIIIGLGIIVISYVLLGFPLGGRLESEWSVLVQFCQQNDLSIYIIGLSIILFLISARLYSRYSIAAEELYKNTGAELMKRVWYDEASPGILRSAERKLTGFLNSIRSGFLSQMQQTVLFQYSLFNPRFSIMLYSLIVLVFSVNTVVFIASSMMTERFSEVFFYILPPSVIFLISYYIDASRLSLEFLQHRNRLSILRHRSLHNTRKDFAKTVFLSYLYIAGKRFLLVSAVMLSARFIFPDVLYIKLTSVPVVLAAGMLIYLLIISISLILSDDIRSANCIGWNIGTIVIAFGLWKLLSEYWHYGPEVHLSWILILSFVVFTAGLLLHAVKCLTGSELDFVSPEQLT